MRRVVAQASPSLALIKYWGKCDGGVNIPATTSVAVALDALVTTTEVSEVSEAAEAPGAPTDDDVLLVEGVHDTSTGLRRFFDAARKLMPDLPRISARSTNNFPTAAGLASSSSGFAALAAALSALSATSPPPDTVSRLARVGSGSAARAVFGGFTLFRRGADHAEQVFDSHHWPELCVVVAAVGKERKPISSRQAMIRAAETSPFFSGWVEVNEALVEQALGALESRDLERLGVLMRRSYLAMFSTMFTSDPPVLYWLPETVAVLRLAEQLRAAGVGVFETMDAGPQVKLVCEARDLETVVASLQERLPEVHITESVVGGPASIAHDDP